MSPYIYLIEREIDDGDSRSDFVVDVDYGAFTSKEAAQEVVDRAESLREEENQAYRHAVKKWNVKRQESLIALEKAGILTGVSLSYNDYPLLSRYVRTPRLIVSEPIEIVE